MTTHAHTEQDDAQLARKVVAALKAYDAADAVKKEKAVIVGGLLADAQKQHPGDKAFEAFLERAGGIQIRRAKDLIPFALGRKDFDKHQADHAAAQQRLRDKQKAEKIEREKAKAALPKPAPKPDASHDASPKPKPDDASKWSADTHRIKWYLARGVGRYCNVQIYRNNSKAGLTFVGFKSDIDFAAWLFDHLSDFVHNALFEHLLDCLAPEGKERKEEIRGFVIGCAGRITARLIAMCDQSKNARTTNGNALVVIKDHAIKDLLKAEGITLRSSSGSRARFSDGARTAGASAGDRASFGRPLSVAGAVLRIGKA